MAIASSQVEHLISSPSQCKLNRSRSSVDRSAESLSDCCEKVRRISLHSIGKFWTEKKKRKTRLRSVVLADQASEKLFQ